MRETSRRCSKSALVITICFLTVVFVVFAATLVTSGGKMYYSIHDEPASWFLKTDDPGFLDMTAARIASLKDSMSNNLFLSREMGFLSASVQYAAGKRMVSIGAANMLKTPEGYLYDITDEYDFADELDEILAFRAALDEDIPFLYIHEHTLGVGNSDEDELPAGYADLDFSFENSDLIVRTLRGAGIDVLDSRDVLGASGLSQDEISMRTDHHWTTLADLLMARAVAEELKAISGADIDPDLLSPDLFDSENYPEILLGQRGERVGTQNTVLDDVALYWPVYDTHIVRTSRSTRYDEEEVYEGTFREAVIRWNAMERNEDGYSTFANGAYGFTEASSIYRNDAAPDVTLLVLKDSYSGQISSFLSLLFRNVVVIDLRKVEEDGMYYVRQYDPDIVMIGFCQQMLMERQYTLYAR